MRGLNVHKNIPVSTTKLTLSLRIGFISSYLIAENLFPINPRAITGLPKMSLLLEARSMPLFIIKPRFILVTHTDDLSWYITFNQQGKMFVQNEQEFHLTFAEDMLIRDTYKFSNCFVSFESGIIIMTYKWHTNIAAFTGSCISV